MFFPALMPKPGCSTTVGHQGWINPHPRSRFSIFFIRDVSSVELLQKYHQGIRSEIEARGAKFSDCVTLGKALLTRKHRDSAEVKPRRRGRHLFILRRASDRCFH